MARRPEPPEECSQCGAEIPRRALACPECGADENTGWDTNPYLPDGDRDVPDYLTEDYDADGAPPIFDAQPWTPRGWWFVAVIVVIFMVFVFCQHGSLWTFKQD
jgi:hypothetical protein